MLTPSDKLCTIANGNRSGHDLIVLNCLLKPILFMVTTECIGKKKKSANQFGVKPRRKLFETRDKHRLKFIKLKLASSQIFRNILIQYCNYLNTA